MPRDRTGGQDKVTGPKIHDPQLTQAADEHANTRGRLASKQPAGDGHGHLPTDVAMRQETAQARFPDDPDDLTVAELREKLESAGIDLPKKLKRADVVARYQELRG